MKLNGAAEASARALAASMPPTEEELAKAAMRLAFPGKPTCVGETDLGATVGFGVVFRQNPMRRHAVKLRSFADVQEAISLLRAWDEEDRENQ